MRQDIVLVDVDSQTHTCSDSVFADCEEGRRAGAVVGKNRKKPGKPCLQWNVGFVRGEAVSQRLMAGNTHGVKSLEWTVSDVQKKLGCFPSILRLDGGYLSKETLNYVVEHRHYLCMSARYDWILAQGIQIDEARWIRCDAKSRLYELGLSRVISTSPHRFRTIPVLANAGIG